MMFAVILVTACAHPLPVETVEADGVVRSFELVVPPQPAAHPALVVVLHGGGSSAAAMRRYVHFEDASRDAALVAYPRGIRRHWNDARGGYPGPDDVAFLRALIVKVQARYRTDPARVDLAGISNGGVMALTAACRGLDVAAVAAVSANLPPSSQRACKPAHPVSVILVDGTADPIIPYDGGMVKAAGAPHVLVLSAQQTAAVFRRADRCNALVETTRTRTAPDGTWTQFQRWAGCAAGTSVVLASVHGGGHAWPGYRQYLPAFFIGTASRSFDGDAVIWRFFTTGRTGESSPASSP